MAGPFPLNAKEAALLAAIDGDLDAIFGGGAVDPSNTTVLPPLSGYAPPTTAGALDIRPVVRNSFRSALLGLLHHLVAEGYTEVGATGAPAFQNGWTNYLSGYNTAAFFKDPFGVVHLKGLIQSGKTIPTVAFQLPAGYLPAGRCLFAASTNPNTIGRIDVDVDGSVWVMAGSPGWISLDGLSFRAAQ
jgi:hypothetical protein